jgi:hypothetical protein
MYIYINIYLFIHIHTVTLREALEICQQEVQTIQQRGNIHVYLSMI